MSAEYSTVRPSKKQELVSILFSEMLWSGGKLLFLLFFDSEVLMLQNTIKHTVSLLILLLLHPSVQAYQKT